jgi:hypothetical protein
VPGLAHQLHRLSPLDDRRLSDPCLGVCALNRFLNGVVVVADIKEGTVLHRLTGHVEEIHALSWLPPQYAKQQEKKTTTTDDGSSWRRAAGASLHSAARSQH